MKNIRLASNILKLGGSMLFASSFFVVDSEDAVKRRYLSLGMFLTGIVIDYSLDPQFKLKNKFSNKTK